MVSSPNPGDATSELLGVGLLTSYDSWAVGDEYSSNQNNTVTHALAEHWDGSMWTSVPAANASTGSNLLRAVSGSSSTDVWAVGDFVNVGETQGRTLAEHWNGSNWTVYPTPISGGVSNSLTSVAALSRSDAWAVGTANSGEYTDSQLIEHWDGAQWTAVIPPSLGNASQSQPFSSESRLNGLVALSANDVWAVGSGHPPSAQLDTPSTPLIEHWNGSAWSIVPNPSMALGRLNGIAASGPANIWAVGASGGGITTMRPLIEHWNGSAWSVVPSVGQGSGDSVLLGVAVAPSGAAWAVGQADQDATMGGGKVGFIEGWNGQSWRMQPIPSLNSNYWWPNSVATVSGAVVWAVGFKNPASGAGAGHGQTLIERY